MGMTHIRLAEASEDVLYGALHTAWKLRVEKSAKSGKKNARRKIASGRPREKARLRSDPYDRAVFRPENLRYKAAAH